MKRMVIGSTDKVEGNFDRSKFLFDSSLTRLARIERAKRKVPPLEEKLLPKGGKII